MGLLSKEIIEFVQSSLKSIGKTKMQLTNKLEQHINTLTEAINEVRHIVEAETYDVDPNGTLVTPLLLPLVKIEV